MKGWIKLSRLFLNSVFWIEPRRFSRAEAVLDILLRVNHSATRILLGTKFLNLWPGQLLTSQVQLAERWGWNRKTVASFLRNLRDAEILDFQTVKGTDKGYTFITFHNFERFPLCDDTDLDIQPDIETPIKRTRGGQGADIYENEEKEKKLLVGGGIGEGRPGSSNARGVDAHDVLQLFPGSRIAQSAMK